MVKGQGQDNAFLKEKGLIITYEGLLLARFESKLL